MSLVTLLVGSLAITGCVAWSESADDVETRRIPVYVSDDRFEPMNGAYVVSSVGSRILDSGFTDANAIALLDVADGGHVSVHHEASNDLVVSQTVAVLPEDGSISIRFRFATLLPHPTFDVDIEVVGLPSDMDFAFVRSGFGGPSCSDSPWPTASLTFDERTCGRQSNDAFSLWGSAGSYGDNVYYSAVAKDLALGQTSATLTFVPDEARNVDVGLAGHARPAMWFLSATPYWRDVPIGGYGSVYGVLEPSDGRWEVPVRGADSGDSLAISAEWQGSSDDFFYAATFVPPGTTGLTVDTDIHPPTLSSASWFVSNGTVHVQWHASDDGTADLSQVAVRWQSEDGVSRIWLATLPPAEGATHFTFPPSGIDGDRPGRFLRVSFDYAELDYVDGYVEARSPPPVPRFRRILRNFGILGPIVLPE